MLVAVVVAGCGRPGDTPAEMAAPKVMYQNQAKDTASSQPNFYLEHLDAAPPGDLRFYYFFATPAGEAPQLELAQDSPLAAELEAAGDNRYRVRVDIPQSTRGAGTRWPEQGAVGFTLRLMGGSPWDRAIEYSSVNTDGAAYTPNPRVPLYSAGGDLLGGDAAPAMWLANSLDTGAVEHDVPLKSGSDIQPPTLVLGAHDAATPGREITLSGTVVDKGSGVDKLEIVSDRQGAHKYPALITPPGFSVTVPLAVGSNRLQLTARDNAGNQAVKVIKVKRLVQAAQLSITAPAAGTLTTEKSIAVSGRVTADPEDTGVVIKLGGRQQVLSPTATPGFYDFLFAAVALKDGNNHLKVSLTTAGSSAQAAVDVVSDRRPPTLTVAQPAAPASDAISLILTGTVVDAISGVAAIEAISDRAPGLAYAGTIAADGNFTIEVPLGYGTSTLTVRARDGAGNLAQAAVRIKRSSLLAAITQPADGSHVSQAQVTVSGTVYADATEGNLRVIVAGYQQTPVPNGGPGQYSYRFAGVPLFSAGLNTLRVRVESATHTAKAATTVYYDAAPSDDHSGPVISLRAPAGDSAITEANVTVAGDVADPAGVASVIVAGHGVALIGATPANVSFHQNVLLPAADGPFTLVVSATDKLGNVSTQTLHLRRDSHPPLIAVTDPVPAAGVLHAIDNPLTLRGTVNDSDLAGFSINGESLQLLPGAQAGQFVFDTRLRLPYGADQPVELLAWDLAGNQTRKTYTARSEAQASIEIISPRDGASYTIGAGAESIPVVARIVAAPAGAIASAQLGATTAALVRDGDSYTGEVVATGLSGQQDLGVRLKTAGGQTLASSSSRFKLVDDRNAPLALLRSDPDNGSNAAEPTAPVTFYFNRPVDMTRLVIALTETVHGEVFDVRHPGKMLAVHRDQQPVAGNLALLPGGSAATFYPARELAYGAVILISVSYDGVELARSTFQVRNAPTLLQGVVVDQFRQPAGGVEVTLPKLGLSATTDIDGNYSFGFGSETRDIPEGRYRLVVNPGMKMQPLGSLEFWATLQAGKFNHLNAVQLPVLNPQVPFVHVASGQGATLLAASDLQLDFSGAQLLFPNQRRDGDIHVQFVSITAVPVPAVSGSAPLWAYAVQPPGVQVTGSVSVQINPPQLFGSTRYLPADGTYVLLVGIDNGARMLRPAGVAQIQSRRLVSTGANDFGALDYIGVAFVASSAGQLALAQCAQGQITLAELTRRLAP